MTAARRSSGAATLGTALLAVVVGLPALIVSPGASAAAGPLPEIRMHSANQVPACVTPDRLMQFLRSRHPDLSPRYRHIADWYRHWGEQLRVRWDFAFFQMLHETNYLKFRRANGQRGDVHERQFNFAGLGATGGGVPGDSFPDVKTGVLGQIQHLVAYSGQKVKNPVAPRTRKKQHHIVSASQRARKPIRFSDLTRRWAADPRYHIALSRTADRFMKGFCRPLSAAPLKAVLPAPKPRPAAHFDGTRLRAFSGLGGPVPVSGLKPGQ